MKKTILMTFLWFTAGSVYVLAGQGEATNDGGAARMHEARFSVRDYSTKKPLANAALYDKTGKQLGITDPHGSLMLDLPASAEDVYQMKSEGFTPIDIRLTQAEKKSADYEVFLQHQTSSVSLAEQPKTINKNEDADDTEMVKVYVKQDPKAYKKSMESEPSNVEFAVQLSATSKPITNKNSLKSWEDLGPVYIHSENGLYKVRIGPFGTQEDAKSVLLKAKARGTKDAFIVVQKGTENHPPYEFQSHPAVEPVIASKTEPAKTPKKEPAVNKEVMPVAATSNVEYKVRLASYLHPGAFSTKDVEKYGPLESYRQGEWTIMLIGGFKNEADAIKVKNDVISKGFKDAAVVMDQDGILVETK